MRTRLLVVLIFFLTIIVVWNAYYKKRQFFTAAIYITKSNPCMAVMYTQALILVILTAKALIKIFFGKLRPIEREHLMEKWWFALTETCLAFTVFKDDITPKFAGMFTLLFMFKTFHWLAEERVDFMERSPVTSILFHVRIVSLLLTLGAFDVNFVMMAYQTTISKGASVQLVFGFEYAILLTLTVNTVVKYTLHVIDLQRQLPWDYKAIFLQYTDLVMNFVKITFYIMFVLIMVKLYTVPLFAIHPIYHTFKGFKKSIRDVIMSRRAIRNMNNLYPDATPEELTSADNVCIICREEMLVGLPSKKLPCNHIFHTSCLRSWFQRQQTCPICRQNVLRTPSNGQTNPRPQQQPSPNPQQPSSADQPNHPSTSNEQNMGPPREPGPWPTYSPMYNLPFGLVMLPPMPPFERLSEEDLRLMVEQTRAGLEARIRCLRNIQTLVDTSKVMLQQYCNTFAVVQSWQNMDYQSSSAQSNPETSNMNQESRTNNMCGSSSVSESQRNT